jgi:hypothetical protein
MQDPDERTPVSSAEASTVLDVIDAMERLATDLRPLAVVFDRLSGSERRVFLERLRGRLREVGDRCHDGARTIWHIVHGARRGN